MDDYNQIEHPDEHTLDTVQQPEAVSSGNEPSKEPEQTSPSPQESKIVSEQKRLTDDEGRHETAKEEQDWQKQNSDGEPNALSQQEPNINKGQNVLNQQEPNDGWQNAQNQQETNNSGWQNTQNQQGPNNGDWQNVPNQQGFNGGWQNPQNQQEPNGGWQNPQNQQGPNGGWQNPQNQQGPNGRWQNPQNQPPGGWMPPLDGNGQPQEQAPWQQGQNRQNPNVPYPPNPYHQEPPSGNYYYQGQPSGNFYPQNRQPMQKPPANNMAVTSMVLGIASLLICCCCFPIGFIIGFALGMGGLVLAILSKKGQPFSGFAIAGLILSILGICSSLFFFGCYLLVANMMKDPQYSALFYEIFEQYYNNGR